MVKIKSLKAKEKHTIPIMYWDSPYIWLRSEFDTEKFEINVSKDEYEKHIKEIINTLLRKGEIETDDKAPGWIVENDIGFKPNAVKFREYDDLENISKNEYEKHNYIKDYINLIDRNISVPLFAYLLASTLSSLHFIPKDFDRKFIVSMTGGTIRNRERVALMFTNVHNRSREFCLAKQYFEMHHLLKADTTAEILHKAKAGKDSVVIAFEPDRKMSNYIKEVFIDNMDNYDVQSNCFIIAKYAEEIPFETLNIDIPVGFDEKNIDNYFRNEDYEDIHSDYFMESIYYFVSRLCDKINNDKKYLRKKYKEFRDNNSYNQKYFKRLSDNAYNIAVKLCFAYEMYMKTYKEEDYKADFRRIVAVVKRSFPTDDEMRNKQLRKISKICCALDNYLNESKHKNIYWD